MAKNLMVKFPYKLNFVHPVTIPVLLLRGILEACMCYILAVAPSLYVTSGPTTKYLSMIERENHYYNIKTLLIRS